MAELNIIDRELSKNFILMMISFILLISLLISPTLFNATVLFLIGATILHWLVGKKKEVSNDSSQ